LNVTSLANRSRRSGDHVDAPMSHAAAKG